jgi:glycosyltransferase involved in cell wall biosynthesis
LTRVLFLQQQPCMRALKYAAGLRNTGAAFELGFACQGRTLTEWYGAGDELFDRWWHLGPDPTGDLDRVEREFRPDVVHSHNLPDRLTVSALDVLGGRIPVIHDVHDLQSLRRTPYEDGFPEPADPLLLEKQAVGGCDALVVVSEQMAGAIATRHGLPERTLTFPNYAVAADLPSSLPPPHRRRHGPFRIVYQGTLSTNGGHYDLRRLFTRIAGEGMLLDLYPGRRAAEYEALAEATPGLTCHQKLTPRGLMDVLPGYDFGWAGFNAGLNAAHLDTALPNKLFEYIGCGLPVLTLGHRALAQFVAHEGVGVSLPTLDGLAGQLESLDVSTLRRRVADARQRLTVEANIGRIAGLYEELAAA